MSQSAETELAGHEVRRFYTVAMLAGLVGVPPATVRSWQRRGWLRPARVVRRLAYFDFQEVTAARRLAELTSAGLGPRAIERQLAALARWRPGVQRPLAELPVVIEGKKLLLREEEGLIDPSGQRRIDFETADTLAEATHESERSILSLPPGELGESPQPDELLEQAAQLEDEGRLETAVELYRAALAAGGPRPEICFQLAELLYRLGQVPAAIERYYMAIELDEDYVEARANLGCALAETGELELAVAAFEGALRLHRDYPDVHYHLARTLDELGRPEEAQRWWRSFWELAPDSPWAAEAEARLGDSGARSEE